MTQKSCLLGKGYSVMDNLYNKDVSSRSTCSRRKLKAAPCGESVYFCPGLELIEEHLYIHTV